VSFTDDDLKRLKARGTYQRGGGTGCWIRADQFQALLARLEAAERIVEFVERTYAHHEGVHIFSSGLRAWRNAAGK
jgi:hypothetical protein